MSTTITRDRLSWLDRAECRRMDRDPDLWFPEGTGARPMTQGCVARAICRGCPVRQPCLDLALSVEGPADSLRFGIWGGLGAQERGDLVWMTARGPR